MTANLAEILGFLVSCPTVSYSSNLAIIDFLDDFFAHLGFKNSRIAHPNDPKRSNLLCQVGPDYPGGLMLSGHTDVVPIEGQDWSSDPFELIEKNGCYFGRGTTDMKGFIAAVCCAVSQLNLNKLTKPLSLLWTYDEEIGCQGSAIAAPLLKNYFKYLPEVALIGEPTDFTILRMHSGHVSLKIIAKGKGAHSSNPSLGISAIKALNRVLNAVFKLEEELAQETPRVNLNVGQIIGGSAVNIIPDEATAIIGFRPLPTSSIKDLFSRIEQAALKPSQEFGVKISVILEQSSPPMLTPADTKLEKILKIYARPSEQIAAAFSTDGGNLCEHNIPCLIFGPGTINIAHQANEYINKADLQQAVDKLRNVIVDYLF